MSGGMDWFRWHHGTVTDPRFALVARKSSAALPDVLAVWAFLLERASESICRGSFGEIDHEAIDCLFNFPATECRTKDIINALIERGMIENDAISKWEQNQTKRERIDNGAAERKRKQREKQAEMSQINEMSHHVTPCHDEKHDVTPRGEERREEENIKTLESKTKTNTPRKKRVDVSFDARQWLLDRGATPQHADDWLEVRKRKKGANTLTAFEHVEREALTAGLSIDQVAEMCARKPWCGFEAQWVIGAAKGYGQGNQNISAFERRKQDDREFMRLKSFDEEGGDNGNRIVDIN